ncbi:hypothetical protein QSJ19_19210 [Gordonia sp. ABSL11-1]|uniref:hypothetical protein n=1 Tax=Gordonia sp. ABSL11-1 TaxID=3053924 RepID=UPI002574892A|nr:hypothetical protein [Gordonia sp. ABSL11-1]MDL9947670.1 hypothetical protein [Gordonia sp. ABSL11-1]
MARNTVIAWTFSSGSTRRTQGGDFYLATSGDLDLATNGDFLMAMDTLAQPDPPPRRGRPVAPTCCGAGQPPRLPACPAVVSTLHFEEDDHEPDPRSRRHSRRRGAPDLSSLPPALLAQVKRMVQAEYAKDLRAQLGTVPRTVNWHALSPVDLEHELLELNAFVDRIRHEYGLPPQIIPPMWHRHPELIW